MHKKTLALCLVATLLANTSYGVAPAAVAQNVGYLFVPADASKDTARTVGFVTFAVLYGIGLPLIVVGSHPNVGKAWEFGATCGNQQAICIGSCMYGCQNAENKTCEMGEGCPNACILEIENYTYVGSIALCPHSECRGGSACLPHGEAVDPSNLNDPQPEGTAWGRALVGLGIGSVLVGISLMIYGAR